VRESLETQALLVNGIKEAVEIAEATVYSVS
jgi:hypothetical protein